MTTIILAQHWHDADHMDGGWWWVMGIGWLVFLALVAAVVFVLVRHATTPRAGTAEDSGRRSAEDLLADRLARGEIDVEEYRQRREALRG